MNIAFTDIDGVLNREGSVSEQHECNRIFPIDPELFRLYVMTLNDLQLNVVLSSSWRGLRNWRAFEHILKSFGFNGMFLGRTPRLLGRSRGLEVQEFLSERFETESFVIVDDMPDMQPYNNHLIQTDPITGFTIEDAQKMKELFENA